MSLLAVCNQEDKDKTVLLGTRIGRGYLRTILVRIREPKPISQVTDYKDFLKEHLEASGAKAHEVFIYLFIYLHSLYYFIILEHYLNFLISSLSIFRVPSVP